jgi:hypothetical protein
MEILACWVVLGTIAGLIARARGRTFFGWFNLTAICAIIALPILIFLPSLKKKTMQMVQLADGSYRPVHEVQVG